MRPSRKRLLVAGTAVVLGGSLIAALTAGTSSEPQTIAIQNQTPAGNLPDARASDPVTGREVTFAQFRGKPLFQRSTRRTRSSMATTRHGSG